MAYSDNNENAYPFRASNYFVITDKGSAGFSKISGITLGGVELKPFVEGGLRCARIIREQSANYNTLTLEKGKSKPEMWDVLGELRTMIIVCLSAKRTAALAYSVTGAVLKSVELSDLKAMDSSLLISSAKIAYRTMSPMDVGGGSSLGSSAMNAFAGVAASSVSGVSTVPGVSSNLSVAAVPSSSGASGELSIPSFSGVTAELSIPSVSVGSNELSVSAFSGASGGADTFLNICKEQNKIARLLEEAAEKLINKGLSELSDLELTSFF